MDLRQKMLIFHFGSKHEKCFGFFVSALDFRVLDFRKQVWIFQASLDSAISILRHELALAGRLPAASVDRLPAAESRRVPPSAPRSRPGRRAGPRPRRCRRSLALGRRAGGDVGSLPPSTRRSSCRESRPRSRPAPARRRVPRSCGLLLRKENLIGSAVMIRSRSSGQKGKVLWIFQFGFYKPSLDFPTQSDNVLSDGQFFL